MPQPDHKAAIDYALGLLSEKLSPDLTYHNLWHTQHDVMPAAVRLAKLSRLTGAEISLVEVAAAYHDIGFIDTYTEHELAGVRILIEVLPRFGYTPEMIDRISSLVLSTRLPQSPVNLLEQILADSDLDILGRPEFIERNEALRQEISRRGEPIARSTWLEQQLGFLREHRYFTPAARKLLDAGKLKNISLLEERLS